MTIKVSNSEALSLTCEAKWMYAFHPGYNLEPKTLSMALTRGNVGHKALEHFFTGVMEGQSRDKCEALALQYLVDTMSVASSTADMPLMEIITELLPLMKKYFESHTLNTFLSSVEILGVEYGFEAELPGGFILPGRADLVVYYKKGQFKGETMPVDNKFVYNFWSEDDFRMNSQIPGYIYGLREAMPDRVITRGMINQLRYRKNAVEQFVMTPIRPEKGEVTEIIANHINCSGRVKELKETPVEELRKTVRRMLNKYNCKNCGFRSLCKSEITGGNTRELIKMSYQPNSYGYGGDEED
jgi:hypothetical protein